jgi:hypothetical protein
MNIFFFQYTIIQYIQGLCQSGPGTANYALFPVAFATNYRVKISGEDNNNNNNNNNLQHVHDCKQ